MRGQAGKLGSSHLLVLVECGEDVGMDVRIVPNEVRFLELLAVTHEPRLPPTHALERLDHDRILARAVIDHDPPVVFLALRLPAWQKNNGLLFVRLALHLFVFHCD